ncbi:HD-GYP domain-containing protein, partial [Streptomyces alfalfae]
MRSVPMWARAYILCVTLAGASCAAPALGPHTPWPAVALLAVLYAGCEHEALLDRLAGRTGAAARRRAPRGPGTLFPVLLAGVFLLPPAAAALVAVPGALPARPPRPPPLPSPPLA